jgi:hypothetical protein
VSSTPVCAAISGHRWRRSSCGSIEGGSTRAYAANTGGTIAEVDRLPSLYSPIPAGSCHLPAPAVETGPVPVHAVVRERRDDEG